MKLPLPQVQVHVHWKVEGTPKEVHTYEKVYIYIFTHFSIHFLIPKILFFCGTNTGLPTHGDIFGHFKNKIKNSVLASGAKYMYDVQYKY